MADDLGSLLCANLSSLWHLVLSWSFYVIILPLFHNLSPTLDYELFEGRNLPIDSSNPSTEHRPSMQYFQNDTDEWLNKFSAISQELKSFWISPFCYSAVAFIPCAFISKSICTMKITAPPEEALGNIFCKPDHTLVFPSFLSYRDQICFPRSHWKNLKRSSLYEIFNNR